MRKDAEKKSGLFKEPKQQRGMRPNPLGENWSAIKDTAKMLGMNVREIENLKKTHDQLGAARWFLRIAGSADRARELIFMIEENDGRMTESPSSE